MSKITVRDYKKGDWRVANDLMYASMDYHVKLTPLHRFPEANHKVISSYIHFIAGKVRAGKGKFILAELEPGKPIGLGYAELKHDSEAVDKHAHKLGEIHEIYVDESARGQGVATELMKTLEAWLKEQGCKMLRVTSVYTENPPAQKLYEKLGYVPITSEYAKKVI